MQRRDSHAWVRLSTFEEAHANDVHGLCVWKPNEASSAEILVSGSKDATLRAWQLSDDESTLAYLGDLTDSVGIHYECPTWITAMASCHEGLLAGTRHGILQGIGRVAEEELQGQLLFQRAMSLLATEHKSKPPNRFRVTGVKAISRVGSTLTDFIAVGRPTELQIFKRSSGAHAEYEATGTITLHRNDWVYCIEPLAPVADSDECVCAVVLGDALYVEKLNLELGVRCMEETLVWQGKSACFRGTRTRAHIAAVVQLQSNPAHLAGACFDSAIRIFDITRQRPVKTAYQEMKEHEGRCWSVLEYEPHQLLSCADDGYIMLWDTRAPATAAIRSEKHVGRVSCLHKTARFGHIVASTCPDEFEEGSNPASLHVWDLRRPSGRVSTTELTAEGTRKTRTRKRR